MSDSKEILYVSDLDGTLLTPQSCLPDEAADRLNHLIDKGLQFTIATARNYDSVYPVLCRLNLNIPVILFNGVYLTDFKSGKNIDHIESLCPDVVRELMAIAKPYKIDPFIYIYEDRHQVFYRNTANQASRNYLEYVNGLGSGNVMEYVPNYEFLKVASVSGILFIGTFHILEGLYKDLTENYRDKLNMYFAEDISQPKFYWLQIFHPKANKGSMLIKLAKLMELQIEKTVAFGDYLNDIEMFNVVGRSIAMANALPEVREAADEIIGSNSDLAVVEYLEKQILM